MAAPSISSQTTEGPVLTLINKRIRALRKKLNRISQMEESLSSGKTLNKEQEETLRSKPAVLAGIDELEKLRQPLAEAVNQEIHLVIGENENENENESNAAAEEEVIEANVEIDDERVADLLKLIYFGSVFDVTSLAMARENMLLRTHERSCCITYDYVTDDDAAGEPLREEDLDLISMLGSLLISRPVDSSLSHKNALEKCVERAKLWIANSEQPIEPDSRITYAGLRERLNKIMASDYFTTIPKLKAPLEVAAAAGNYASFQPAVGSAIPHYSVNLPGESSAAGYEPEEEESPSSHDNESYNDESGNVEELHQGVSEVENISQVQTQTDMEVPDTEAVDQNSVDVNSREQEYASRISYQNYRGGRGGGGRRGYANGRGGRGANRGSYQNGRSQFYDQSGGHYQRNYYNRGRGSRGTGGNHNYTAVTGHDDGVQAAT